VAVSVDIGYIICTLFRKNLGSGRGLFEVTDEDKTGISYSPISEIRTGNFPDTLRRIIAELTLSPRYRMRGPKDSCNLLVGRAIGQAVSRWLLAAAARVQTRV
jgi:hypothetical protein